MVGALLMVAGVGLFGTMSGFVASWFLTPSRQKEEAEIDVLRREISELRSAVLEGIARPVTPPADATESTNGDPGQILNSK